MVNSNGDYIFFSRSYYNKPFIMTHFCPKFRIPRIKSITLVNARDSEHYLAWAVFQSIWKQGYFFRVEVVSDLTYEFCSCDDISVNHILTKSGHLEQWQYDFWVEVSKDCETSFPNKVWALGAVKLWLFILGFSNDWE